MLGFRSWVAESEGSFLILSSFIVLMVSLMSVTYWQLLRVQSKSMELRQGQIQAYYAARGGVEDAMHELKKGGAWGGIDMSPQWSFVSGDTFFKSSTLATNPLTNFDYPVTISVTVVGDPDVGTVDVSSVADVLKGDTIYNKRLDAKVIRSINGELHILSIEGR